jgi:tetratricopeptide (TPR) repeat protein
MNRSAIIPALLVVFWVPGAAAASNYSGEWSYQALNAGDTNFKVEHQSEKIVFYRVLHPEFQGKRYKLEHMYKGTVSNNQIRGKMWVREEGMADFEFLRPFSGEIHGDTRMVMDELPLKRVGVVLKEEEPPASKFARVVIQRKQEEKVEEAVKEPAKAPPPAEAEPEKAAPAGAPPKIPKLIPVSRRMKTARAKKVEALLREGDALYDQKCYRDSMDRYEAALKLDPQKVELLYKLGLGHGILGSLAARKSQAQKAARHYRKAVRFWEQAVRYDPYNWGARENIKRAKKKLARLTM